MNAAAISILSPKIQANKRQAAQFNTKIRTMDSLTSELARLLDKTDAPSDVVDRFNSLTNSFAEFKCALMPDNPNQTATEVQEQPQASGHEPPSQTSQAEEQQEEQQQPLEQVSQFEDLERQRSIVLIGLPESKASTASARHESDLATASKLLKDELGIETSLAACYRLGNHNLARSGPRLLGVQLPSRQFQKMTLGKWKQKRTSIRTKPGFERLLIRPSMTRAQREEEKQKKISPMASPVPFISQAKLLEEQFREQFQEQLQDSIRKSINSALTSGLKFY